MSHILTSMRASLIYNLGTIVTGHTITKPDGSLYTYKRTLNDIPDTPKSVENAKEFPLCNTYYGKDQCNNGRAGILQTTGQNRQILENFFPIQLDIWGIDNDVNLFYEDFLADLQALFGNNYQLVDANGIPWIYTCLYSWSERFALTITRPSVAMSATFDVHYRMRREDPEAQV